MDEMTVQIEGNELTITNPNKVLWTQPRVTKMDYIRYLVEAAPYILPYTLNRMLMIWRYPGGIGGKRIEERSVHGKAPAWLPTILYGGKERILLNNAVALVWVANLDALELHVPFDRHWKKGYPTELVFDLDPAEDGDFDVVLEVALEVKKVLDSLTLFSVAKTSGATGMQIYVPIAPNYSFEDTRRINKFIAQFIHQKMPDKITLDRVVERRGSKLYFDYLQLWRGRTMAVPYSVRARPGAAVSTPVTWEEIDKGFTPADFTIFNAAERIKKHGDLFSPLSTAKLQYEQQLDEILAFIRTHSF